MQKYKMPIRLRIMVCLIGMLLPMCMFAQQITVQGVVKDQTGETVIGASVVQKNTTNGTITGIDGDFSLNVPSDAVIVVSFVGYKSLEVPVKGQKQIMVTLSEDSEMLDEVVVIGYGTMKKSDLTGAVSSLGSKDIKNAPVSNLGQAIQGRISGVQVVDAGKPGDNVSIKIRGLGSINNCDPLVVIDGVPTDLGLSSLNMADVERLDVLKDASATAIYGSRGANGVVMITTKRGTEGKGKLSVSANCAFQNATNIPSLLTQARADIARFLELIIVRVDGSKQEAKVEITEAVKPPDDGDEPGEGDHNPQPPEIEIKLPEDEKIVVDDVEVPPSGGGGIGGNVDNWENEEDVILPVN